MKNLMSLVIWGFFAVSIFTATFAQAKSLTITCETNSEIYEPQFKATLTLEVADDHSFKGQMAYSTLLNHAATLEDQGVVEIKGQLDTFAAHDIYADEVEHVQFTSASDDHKLAGGMLLGKGSFTSRLLIDGEISYISACK
jgi:hypothetical protein